MVQNQQKSTNGPKSNEKSTNGPKSKEKSTNGPKSNEKLTNGPKSTKINKINKWSKIKRKINKRSKINKINRNQQKSAHMFSPVLQGAASNQGRTSERDLDQLLKFNDALQDTLQRIPSKKGSSPASGGQNK